MSDGARELEKQASAPYDVSAPHVPRAAPSADVATQDTRAMDAHGVSGITIRWSVTDGLCTFEGLPVAMMWIDTTLAGVMAGVQAMVGTERFALALQSEGRNSVAADWDVISQFDTFSAGFEAIANIAAVAGWGRWELLEHDPEAKTCRFRVTDSWEGRYQRTLGVCWGSGMLAGKLAGYATKLFGTNCWAEQTAFVARGDTADEFLVTPSSRSIEEEVGRLLATDQATRADMAVALHKLHDEIARRTEAEAEVRRAHDSLEQRVRERTAELEAANARLQREVAERVATAEALRASESRYRTVVTTAPLAFVVWDFDHRIIEWNEHAEATFGWSRDEALGADVFDLIVPSSARAGVLDVAVALRGGRSKRNVINENVTKDGRIVVCDWNNSILHDATGQAVGVLSLALDITEHMQAEADRLQRVEFLENLAKLDRAIKGADTLDDMLGSALDVALSALRADRAWFLFPCDPDAPSWSVPMERTKPEYPGASTLAGELPLNAEGRELMRLTLSVDGPVAWDANSGRTLPREEAARFGILSLLTLALRPRLGKAWMFGLHQCSHARVWNDDDLRLFQEMGRRIADALSSFLFLRDLKESERNYRELVEGTSDLIVRLDADARFVFANHLACSVFGVDPAACVGLSSFDFVHPDDREATRLAFGEWIAKGAVSATIENRQVSRTGHVTETLWTASLHYDQQGRVTRIDGIARDIGEIRRAELRRLDLERKMMQAQKLESLGVLAGGIAHDFNNILMGVLGNAQLARLDLPPNSPALPALGNVEKAALRAADLANQMLAYSGRGAFKIEAVRLGDIVLDMMQLLETAVSKKAVLELRLADDLPLVRADATQLRQMVMNLIINASEALGDESGTITISTGRRTALAQPDDVHGDDGASRELVFFEVTDTGCGMDEATVSKVFDPFFTTKFTGRGLGLATVQGSARGHNAQIEIDSTVGVGTTFRILFPAAPASMRSTDQTPPTLGSGPMQGTILVVDDESLVTEVVRMILTRSGMTVILARDGLEAVETFRSQADAIDVVLLDMMMPRMTGDEVFRELRKIRPDVRVVLSSGYNEQEASSGFSERGLAGFIQKPYRPTELLAVLRSVLDGHCAETSVPVLTT